MGRAREIADLIGGTTPDIILKTSDGAILNLQTSDTTVTSSSVLGAINFQAPDEASGTDAILLGAGIDAVAEGTFSASSNATKLSFKTASSAAASETMSLSSAGLLTIADDLMIKDGGTIGVATTNDAITISSAGIVTFKDDILIKDGGTIGTATTASAITIASTGATTITTTGNETTLSLVSTDADASLGPVIDLHRNSSSPADDDAIGRIIFSGENDADEKVSLVQLIGLNSDVTDGTEDGRLQLFAFKNGTSVNRFDIQPTETSFNDDRVDVDMRVESANQGNQLVVDAGLDAVLIGTSSEYSGTSADLTVNKHLDVGDSSSSDNAVIAGAKSATTGTILSIQSKVSGFSTMPKINFVTSNVGGGSQTGELEFFTTLNASQTLNFKIDGNGDLKANDTSIGSLSDERLKKDIEDFTYDLEKFKKLETKSFKWINPVQHGGKSDTVYGTIAQQIESVDADFITDDLLKDTLDNNGFEETNPDYTLAKDTNGVAKVSKITGKKDAMFISVIQQLISKVETLEDEVKVLKG